MDEALREQPTGRLAETREVAAAARDAVAA
jgi:hypothetical protein